jgi:uncharacterized membrane protein
MHVSRSPVGYRKGKTRLTKFLVAYAATAIVMVVLDLLWLGLIAKPIYQQGIGHLMADKPNVPIAMLFYALFAAGLVVFAVAPNANDAGWSTTLVSAALFGFIAYATYDLTNLATLRDWSVVVSLLDMAWGSTVSLASAAAGKFALERIAMA